MGTSCATATIACRWAAHSALPPSTPTSWSSPHFEHLEWSADHAPGGHLDRNGVQHAGVVVCACTSSQTQRKCRSRERPSLVTSSRSIVNAAEQHGGEPAEAARAEAERLREAAWARG